MSKARSQSNRRNGKGKDLPPYSITLVRSAEKELFKLRDPAFSAVVEHLQQLPADPRPPGSA